MGSADRHPNAGLPLSELARPAGPSDPPSPLGALQSHQSAVPIPPPPPKGTGSGSNNIAVMSYGMDDRPQPSAPSAPPPFVQGVQPIDRPPQNTPLWMDVSSATSQPKTRRGVTPSSKSGLTTVLFFAAITIGVGLAGIIGVTMWGPDKNVGNRSHLASDPPPAMTLPSLPPDEAPSASAAPAASETPPVTDEAKSKKGKPKKGGKKR